MVHILVAATAGAEYMGGGSLKSALGRKADIVAGALTRVVLALDAAKVGGWVGGCSRVLGLVGICVRWPGLLVLPWYAHRQASAFMFSGPGCSQGYQG